MRSAFFEGFRHVSRFDGRNTLVEHGNGLLARFAEFLLALGCRLFPVGAWFSRRRRFIGGNRRFRRDPRKEGDVKCDREDDTQFIGHR